MALELHSDSHLDHNLSQEHIAWLLERFRDKEAFFIETLTLPDHLDEISMGLYGPSVGDEPVAEADVKYVIRGARKCASRVVSRPQRKTRQLTVIAGPHDGKACVLFTSFGGPLAPKEPGDTTLAIDQVQASRDFWSTHALCAE